MKDKIRDKIKVAHTHTMYLRYWEKSVFDGTYILIRSDQNSVVKIGLNIEVDGERYDTIGGDLGLSDSIYVRRIITMQNGATYQDEPLPLLNGIKDDKEEEVTVFEMKNRGLKSFWLVQNVHSDLRRY